MFSTIPSTGTLTLPEHVTALRASSSETSDGVVTTIAPVIGAVWISESCNVPGARRKVDDEIVQFSPVHPAQELLDDAVQHGPRHTSGLSPGFRKPMDMSLTPYCSNGWMRSPKAMGVRLIPIIRGTLGP